jgi:RNA polymerase sigma factor FliA
MKNLVKKYKQDTIGIDGKLRDQLVMDYAALVRFVAQRIAARLPANVDLDDLISAGVIGLMDAIEKYDPSRDNKFKTYAEFRVRGAILDELRSQDWVPRTVREKAKKIDRAHVELEQRYGRTVRDDEVSKALGLDIDEYHEMVTKVRSANLLSIDELSGGAPGDRKSLLECLENLNSRNPFVHIKSQGVKDLLVKHIDDLPEKQKLVLSLYYYEDLNLREIGRVLEVTESRVSQLHTQGVERLRELILDLLTEE